MPLKQISLNGNHWLFKGFVGEDWRWRNSHLPATTDTRGWHTGTVPGSVHHDLWVNGEIPDPYYERNSLLLEWIPDRTWVYKTSVFVEASDRGKRFQLRFEGVDYEAEFFLNGESLGRHRGMYTPAQFEISDQLRYGEENLITVVIEPAPYEQPQIGRTTRVRTHKSRMTYWWDFCPRMVHVGIWENVTLDVTGPVRIEDVAVRPLLSEDLTHADINVSTELSSTQTLTVDLEITLRQNGATIATQHPRQEIKSGHTRLETLFEIQDPLLWWPNGFGDQPLYTAKARIIGTAGDESDRRDVTFGIRRIEFVRNDTPDETALPYVLTVNGKRIYIQGWNWVPIDVIYGVERPEKLEHLMKLAQRAHVNVLRVWGGGLIEKEAFYNWCDRLGILVWQEFILSSSGIDNDLPTDPALIEMMVHEAEQIIPRKRAHPSLMLWCGGNELQGEGSVPLNDTHPMLSALHVVVRRLDPDRHWLPTSPSGPVFMNSLEMIEHDPLAQHDVHGPWEQQGLTEHFTLYNRGTSLFHSEFGAEAITNLATLNRTISEPNRWPVTLDNPVWEHLASWWVKVPRWTESLGPVDDLETLARATQYLQASDVAYVIESNRRRQWRNSGTMPWQFNEPYPMAACTSAVDYYGQPKPLYYAVAGAYESLHVSAKFASMVWENARNFEAEVWVSNSSWEPIDQAALDVALVGASGKIYAKRSETVTVPANASAFLVNFDCQLADVDEVFFLDLRLQVNDAIHSQNRYLFTRSENLAPTLKLPTTTLELHHDPAAGRLQIANRGDQTALFVWIEAPQQPGSNQFARFDDNHFCLFPGESKTVLIEWGQIPAKERHLQVQGWNT